MPREQDWAIALKKAQRTTARNAQTSFPDQKKEVVDALARTKAKLIIAMKENNSSAIEHELKALIRHRATQLVIALQEWKEASGTLNPTVVARSTADYARDCARLIQSVEHTLSQSK